MGQILKFFGWLVIGIALTLVIFGHLTMVLIYDFDYLLETLFPTDPASLSSIWIILASVFPGGMMWLLGHFLQRLESNDEVKLTPRTTTPPTSPPTSALTQTDVAASEKSEEASQTES